MWDGTKYIMHFKLLFISTLYTSKCFGGLCKKTSFCTVSCRTLHWKVCRRESVQLLHNIYSLDTRTFAGMQSWCAKGRSVCRYVCMIVYVCILGCVGFIRSLKAFASWKYYIVILLRVCMDILCKDGSCFYVQRAKRGWILASIPYTTRREQNVIIPFHIKLRLIHSNIAFNIYNWM